MCVTSQATWSSKARVCPAPWRAHGTAATVTPWSGQVNPWRLGLDEHPHRAGIQRPPPAPPLTLVVAAATSPAPTAATRRTSAEPTRHHDLAGVIIELDGLDDHSTFDADHPRPYPLRLHPVAPSLVFPAVDSRKAKPDNGVHPRMVSYPPTERGGEPVFLILRSRWASSGTAYRRQ